MKSKCELVRSGEVRRRGNTADRAISSSGKSNLYLLRIY
nr:MAG TPA: hypothetical protein [Caudoviricetes sp.]